MRNNMSCSLCLPFCVIICVHTGNSLLGMCVECLDPVIWKVLMVKLANTDVTGFCRNLMVREVK